MSEEWAYNRDEEGVWHNGGFNSREEALGEAEVCYAGTEVQAVYTGRLVPVKVHTKGIAADILESLAEWAYDHFGESGEEWPKATQEQREELDRELSAVLHVWMDRHNLYPGWNAIHDIQRHELDQPITAEAIGSIAQQSAESRERRLSMCQDCQGTGNGGINGMMECPICHGSGASPGPDC